LAILAFSCGSLAAGPRLRFSPGEIGAKLLGLTSAAGFGIPRASGLIAPPSGHGQAYTLSADLAKWDLSLHGLGRYGRFPPRHRAFGPRFGFIGPAACLSPP
jgi:hypothetical protein